MASSTDFSHWMARVSDTYSCGYNSSQLEAFKEDLGRERIEDLDKALELRRREKVSPPLVPGSFIPYLARARRATGNGDKSIWDRIDEHRAETRRRKRKDWSDRVRQARCAWLAMSAAECAELVEQIREDHADVIRIARRIGLSTKVAPDTMMSALVVDALVRVERPDGMTQYEWVRLQAYEAMDKMGMPDDEAALYESQAMTAIRDREACAACRGLEWCEATCVGHPVRGASLDEEGVWRFPMTRCDYLKQYEQRRSQRGST